MLLRGARPRALHTRSPTAARAASRAPSARWPRRLGADVDLVEGAAQVRRAHATTRSGSARRRSGWSPPSRRRSWPRFRALCEAEDVEAVVARDVHRARSASSSATAGPSSRDLSMEFLHDGLPQRRARGDVRAAAAASSTAGPDVRDQTTTLLALLGTPDIGCKEWVIRQYDHEVQAGAVVQPARGRRTTARPTRAVRGAQARLASGASCSSNGINPRFGDIDPYAMACAAVDEALRNASPSARALDRLAILDNFTWGRLRPARPAREPRARRRGLPRRGAALRHAVHLGQGLAQQRVPDRGRRR